jgi:hypothetical protein
MATGNRVVEDATLFPTIHRYARKTFGIDMEGSALAAVAEIERVEHCPVVKGVQDHADPDKDDRFRPYAIEASYRFLTAFLRKEMAAPKRGARFILPQHDTPSFTGRESELHALSRALLDNETERVCTIAGLSGTGGIGKSALAFHFATVHRDRFPDGVIGLRVDGKDVDTIARAFARDAGMLIESDDDRDAPSIMQTTFAGREMLLIFDNAEDASVRDLVPGGRTKAIITTRDRMLPMLIEVPEAARIDVPALPESKSLELLSKRLGNRVSDEVDAAKRVVAFVGGLPLALQIASSILEMAPWRGVAGLAELLAMERQRLSTLAIRGDPHLDVRVSFNASLRLLTPDETDFFAGLSVCDSDGFSLQTAAAVAGWARDVADERLAYLYRLSLVNRPDGAVAARFVLHPLLRAFAGELADERGTIAGARERHARHFVGLLKAADLEAAAVLLQISEDLPEAITAAK